MNSHEWFLLLIGGGAGFVLGLFLGMQLFLLTEQVSRLCRDETEMPPPCFNLEEPGLDQPPGVNLPANLWQARSDDPR